MGKLSFILLSLTLVTGCPAADSDPSTELPELPPNSPPDDPPSDDPPSDDPPSDDPPTGPLVFDGTYTADGVWDLSEAIAGDSLGEVVAALVIDEAVSFIGPPSFVEDEVRDALASMVAGPIADFVDANTPDILDPSTGVLAELSDILSRVEVTTELVIEADPDDPTRAVGVERIVGLRLTFSTQTVDIPLQDAVGALGADSLEADIEGVVFDRTGLSIEPHEFALATDPLADFGLSGLLSIDDVEALAAAAIDCNAIVASVTGGGGLSVSALGQSFSISDSSLVSGCEAIRAEALEQVLGLFRTEIGVVAGGPAVMHDDDLDLIVDRIASEPGYVGTITSLPDSLESDFEIVFDAARQ